MEVTLNATVFDVSVNPDKENTFSVTPSATTQTVVVASNLIGGGVGPEVEQHMADTTIHTSSGEKSTISGHIGNSDIHTTALDKAAISGHISATDIHVSTLEKAAYQAVVDAIISNGDGTKFLNDKRQYVTVPILPTGTVSGATLIWDTVTSSWVQTSMLKVSEVTGATQIVAGDFTGSTAYSWINVIDTGQDAISEVIIGAGTSYIDFQSYAGPPAWSFAHLYGRAYASVESLHYVLLKAPTLQIQIGSTAANKYLKCVDTSTGLCEFAELPATSWGNIGGTLSSQIDLNSALSSKAPSDHNHSTLYEPVNSNIQAHVAAVTGNPHAVSKTDVGLSNVTNDAQIKKSSSSTDGNIAVWSGTTGDSLGSGYTVQTTLASSTTAIPRADAVYTALTTALGDIETLLAAL